jgi:hypothetical protein
LLLVELRVGDLSDFWEVAVEVLYFELFEVWSFAFDHLNSNQINKVSKSINSYNSKTIQSSSSTLRSIPAYAHGFPWSVLAYAIPISTYSLEATSHSTDANLLLFPTGRPH